MNRILTIEENEVRKIYKRQGYLVFSSGYPDLLCYNKKTGEVEFVEVKRGNDPVKKNQKVMHSLLRKIGFKVKVFRLEGDTLLRISGETHRRIKSKAAKKGLTIKKYLEELSKLK